MLIVDLLVMLLVIGGFIALRRMSAIGREGRSVPGKESPPAGRREEHTAPGQRHPGRVRPTPAQLAPLAAALSFLVPGLGHFLLRAPLRGLIWLAGWIVVGLLSRGSHGVVFALMVVAAVDAFLVGRWSEPGDAGSHSNRPGGGVREHD